MSGQLQAKSGSQPTPRVGNLNGPRRQVVPDGIRSARARAGTHQNHSGSSASTLPDKAPSHVRPIPLNATGALERPPKRPRRRTIQRTTYTDIETEPDTQVLTETVLLSDDSRDQYEDSCGSDQTESDTEPDTADDEIPDATRAGLRHWSRTADKQTNNRVLTVRVSTTSGSQEAALGRRTPPARGRITPGRAYNPPVLWSSSVARYSSPLATHSGTTSGV